MIPSSRAGTGWCRKCITFSEFIYGMGLSPISWGKCYTTQITIALKSSIVAGQERQHYNPWRFMADDLNKKIKCSLHGAIQQKSNFLSTALISQLLIVKWFSILILFTTAGISTFSLLVCLHVIVWQSISIHRNDYVITFIVINSW